MGHKGKKEHDCKDCKGRGNDDAHHNPQECFEELVRGNLRFVRNPKYIRERSEQTEGQEPCTVVVTCSDSRVTAPIIFDNLNLGTFFEVQTAGQTIEADDIETIKYALEHLHAKLIVVVGHTQCGAVASTVDSLVNVAIRAEFPNIVRDILPAVETQMKKLDITTQDVEQSPKLRDKLVNGSVKQNAIDKAELLAYLFDLKYGYDVIAGVYSIETGKVKWYGRR